PRVRKLMNRMASNGASRNKVSHSKPGPLVSAERTRCPRRVSVSPNWTSLLRLPGMGGVTIHFGQSQSRANPAPGNADKLSQYKFGRMASPAVAVVVGSGGGKSE